MLVSRSRGGGKSGVKDAPRVSSAGNPREELAKLKVPGYVIRMFGEQRLEVSDGRIIVAMIGAFECKPILRECIARMCRKKFFEFLSPCLCGLSHEV